MTSRRLIAVRHGETDWNAASRVQGQSDIPLNDVGRAQAKAAAVELAALSPTSITSSDLSRAFDTARPLADLTGLPITADERLREVYVGTWEGLHLDEIAAKFPGEWERWRGGEDLHRGGGETRAEVAERTGSAIADIITRPDSGDNVVVVGHGMSTRAALNWLHDRNVIRLAEPAPRMGNATWVIAEIVPPRAD